MYTNGNVSPDPFSLHGGADDGADRPEGQQWSGNNYTRWSNKDYDAVIEQLKTELDPAKRAELFIKANDIEVNDFAEIPLVEPQERLRHRQDPPGRGIYTLGFGTLEYRELDQRLKACWGGRMHPPQHHNRVASRA